MMSQLPLLPALRREASPHHSSIIRRALTRIAHNGAAERLTHDGWVRDTQQIASQNGAAGVLMRARPNHSGEC